VDEADVGSTVVPILWIRRGVEAEMKELRVAGWSGLAGLVLNVAAVALLGDVPAPYRPDDLAAWHGGVSAHADAAVASAWCFTVGLVLLVPWARAWVGAADGAHARAGLVDLGGWLFALGALLDAAGTPAVAAVARFLPASDPANGPAARALLALTLELDATFNALLGAGLVLAAAGLGSGTPRALRVLLGLAGCASLPVGLQAESGTFARLLAVSGPLWLAGGGWLAWRMTRAEAARPD
jgi:hypothetical protein